MRSDQKTGFIFKDYDYYLVPLKGTFDKTSKIEQYVLKFLEEIGYTETVLNNETIKGIKLKDISKWCAANRTDSYNFFKKFPELVLEENLNEGFFDKTSHTVKTHVWITFLLLILMTTEFMLGTSIGTNLNSEKIILLGFLGGFILMFFFTATLIMKMYGEKRTKDGNEETAKWIAFKKHLKEYETTKNYPIDSIILWGLS